MSPSNIPPGPSPLFGPIFYDEIPWSYFARFLRKFRSLSFGDLAGLLGELPSTRKAFPVRIDNLARQLGYEEAPSTAAIIRGHTFYPFAQLEITRAAADRLFSTMAYEAFYTGAPEALVLPGKFHLRICPECAQKDCVNVGAAYWHRKPQLPFMRICSKHRCALQETNVSGGQQMPITAQAAEIIGVLQVDDWGRQGVLASAVEAVVQRADCPSRDQVLHQLRVTLCARGLLPLDIEPTFENLAVALDHIDVPLAGFLDKAMLVEIHEPVIPSKANEILRRVQELAPDAVKRLKETSTKRISVRAISVELGRELGAGFATNWSSREPVRSALVAFTETDEQFFQRAMARMPDEAVRHGKFWKCVKALGLQYLVVRRSSLLEAARHGFDLARAGKPPQGR